MNIALKNVYGQNLVLKMDSVGQRNDGSTRSSSVISGYKYTMYSKRYENQYTDWKKSAV